MKTGWSDEVAPLDSERILRVLRARQVRFVLVGGIAAVVHGYSGATFDLDAVPAADTANLNRLGRALAKLRAVIWADPSRSDLFADGRPPEADDFGYTAEGLRRHRVWHLTSDAGLIDIAFAIDGVGDYATLARNADRVEAFGVRFQIASIDDIITSKRAVARPKDLRALPELEALRDAHR
jgi:hypothetical protein